MNYPGAGFPETAGFDVNGKTYVSAFLFSARLNHPPPKGFRRSGVFCRHQRPGTGKDRKEETSLTWPYFFGKNRTVRGFLRPTGLRCP